MNGNLHTLEPHCSSTGRHQLSREANRTNQRPTFIRRQLHTQAGLSETTTSPPQPDNMVSHKQESRKARDGGCQYLLLPQCVAWKVWFSTKQRPGDEQETEHTVNSKQQLEPGEEQLQKPESRTKKGGRAGL